MCLSFPPMFVADSFQNIIYGVLPGPSSDHVVTDPLILPYNRDPHFTSSVSECSQMIRSLSTGHDSGFMDVYIITPVCT